MLSLMVCTGFKRLKSIFQRPQLQVKTFVFCILKSQILHHTSSYPIFTKNLKKKKLAPSSILREAKIAYYARNMFEAGRFLFFFFVKATWRHAMNPLRWYRGRCQGNVTSRHIDRLAAPTCCAMQVLTSRISLTWPWWIRPWSSIIC